MSFTKFGSALSAGRKKLLLLLALAAIAGSWFTIYRSLFAKPDLNVPLHQSIGIVLADETFREVGNHGKIVLVSMETARAPELKVQMNAFLKQLKLHGGLTIMDKVVLDPGDNPKYRPGSGLSAKRYVKIARKHTGADAIVSFVGAPDLTQADLNQLKAVPKLIAETHSPERLSPMLENKILFAAIVPRYEFPAPGPRQPQTIKQWFDHYFQVVHPDTALPSLEESQ